MIMDASFEEPKQRNWENKYIQLDFSTSIAELEKLVKEMKKEGERNRALYHSEKDWLNQKWVLTAFMEKCKCDSCKSAWAAFDKAYKKT